MLGRISEPFFGRREVWDRHSARLREMLPLQGALEMIERRWPSVATGDPEQPIFVFSAGWRSGSTLVQRLLLSGGDVLIWGEPYTLADYIGQLADSLRAFSAAYPPEEFFLRFHEGAEVVAIKEQWIAHLYPDPADLKRAHRAFLLTLLADPAHARGYSRWGFKDCKYGIEHAYYLKWLFPKAKFLFVYRNPLNAWRSFRLFGAYRRWPHGRVFTARSYGELWRSLMEGYLAHHAAVDGIMVKYEDLVTREIVSREVAEFAGVQCDFNVLKDSITGRGKRGLEVVPPIEMRSLARAVQPLASRLGYVMSEEARQS